MKPTEKQLKLMKKLGITFDNETSKSEASKLIEEELTMLADQEDFASYDEQDGYEYDLESSDTPLFDKSTNYQFE